jgi:hypothetical protein
MMVPITAGLLGSAAMSRGRALTALAGYIAALAAVTLGASPAKVFEWALGLTHQVDALRSLTKGDLERGANVLMFIPAGLLLCHLLARIPRVLVWVLCVLTSCGVEFAQTVMPGRQPSLVDIATNSTGAAIGVLIHAILAARRPSSPERAER